MVVKKIAPSILSADFANLEREIQKVTEAGADWIHVDVMDGHFVPNLTIGAPVVQSIRKVCHLPLDVHLMIENPEKYVDDFIRAGSDYITIHIESTQQPEKLLQHIRNQNVKCGITLRPNTKIETLLPVLNLVDLVLVMTVEPGFGGQSFMLDQVAKIDFLKKYRADHKLSFLIEVDGGVNDQTVAHCKNADVLVAGSYVFGSKDYSRAIQSLKSF